MKKNSLFYDPESGTIFRVLDYKNSEMLVINCIKKQMPYWTEVESIFNYKVITEEELYDITDTYFSELKIPSKEHKYAQERFSLISKDTLMSLNNRQILDWKRY